MGVGPQIAGSLGAYLKAQIQNAGIVVCLYIAAFAVTGVPWWLLTGLLCGVLNVVPNLGPVLALSLALLLKWFAGGGWIEVAYTAGAWLAIQLIDGFFLSPRAAGRAGVNPFLSILITIAGAVLFGPIGMLLAVPVVAVALVVRRALRERKAA
jgi:predicted PurR-regulated permease PerM